MSKQKINSKNKNLSNPFFMTPLLSLLTACSSNDVVDTATMPLHLLDGLVTVVTFGALYPGIGGTTEDLLKKGELNSHISSPLLERDDSPLYQNNPEYNAAVSSAAQTIASSAAPPETSTNNIQPTQSGASYAPATASIEATATPTVASSSYSQNATTTTSSNIKFDQAYSQCVKWSPTHPTLPAGYGEFTNRCDFKIRVTVCAITDKTDACSRKLFGSFDLEPTGSNYSLPGPREVKYIACKDPFYASGSKSKVSGGSLSGTCQR